MICDNFHLWQTAFASQIQLQDKHASISLTCIILENTCET